MCYSFDPCKKILPFQEGQGAVGLRAALLKLAKLALWLEDSGPVLMLTQISQNKAFSLFFCLSSSRKQHCRTMLSRVKILRYSVFKCLCLDRQKFLGNDDTNTQVHQRSYQWLQQHWKIRTQCMWYDAVYLSLYIAWMDVIQSIFRKT